VVGLIIGGIISLLDLAFGQLGLPPVLVSLFTIGLLTAISGGLHLDGLADTADGFLSSRPRERVLEIMRDSHIGVMGVLALIFVLALKVIALSGLSGDIRWKVLLFTPISGRCLLVMVIGSLSYARKKDGLGSLFIHRYRKLFALWSGLCLLVAAVLMFGIMDGMIFLAASISLTILFSLWSIRQIRGFTGDTLGATNEIVETTVLFLAGVGL
jgi:adenosylcobinamide-GDP ribazoletransferase